MRMRWMIALAGIGFAVVQTLIMVWAALNSSGISDAVVRKSMAMYMVGFGIGLAVVAALIGFGIGTFLGRRLDKARDILDAVGHGDLSARMPQGHADELGQLSVGLNRTIDALADERRHLTEEVGTRVGSIRETAISMTVTSTELMESAEINTEEAQRAAAAAEQVSANAHQIAASAEEMTASVREIASTTSETSIISTEAANRSKEVDEAVHRLATSSSDIGSVVKTISAIAEQTNLLALNATIEAARAGDAGRGFAVVAGEVKSLASQTANATADIGKRIAAIQGDTTQAIAAINEIGALISKINAMQQTVATAVEEQSATTAEMSRNIAEAAKGSADIARAISTVAASARNSSGIALTVKDLGDQLSQGSEDLSQVVGARVGSTVAADADTNVFIDKDQAFFDQAVKAHLAWRTRLQSAINGAEMPDRSKACDHTACDLGRWLQAEATTLRAHPAYAPLMTQHSDFHAEVGRIIDLVQARKTGEAKQALLGGALHKTSVETIALIQRMRPIQTTAPSSSAKVGAGLLVWGPQFATGHASIDAQHQQLFRMTGDLHAAMQEGRGRKVIGDLIAFLADYTTRHFADEEQAMRQAKYPDLARHQELHRTLLNQVGDLQRRFNAGEALKTMEVSEFLAGWLRQHILQVDHAYVPSLTSSGMI